MTASRLSNFGIQLLSPLLLVRILDVAAYGQYQEFMVYAALLTTLCAFAIDSSLTYFLPRYPERERSFVLQTTVMTLVMSVFCVCLLLLTKPLFVKWTSYDFVVPLTAYVFFFVNLNWLEYYWIAKRQARVVLYYSAVRLIVRVSVLIVVAYMTRDVLAILWSLVTVEAFRVLVVFLYFAWRGAFHGDLQRSAIVEQLRFAAPVGAAAVVQHAGRSIGRIFIGGTLGPMSLAYYVTGSYLQPIVNVASGGIADAVYPELVRAHNKPGGALRLWQRVNVLNCVVFFPVCVLLIYYAEQIIKTLFTSAYLPAVPVFCIYALFLVRRCFNTDFLLRTSGQTGFMLWGTIGALTLNVSLIVLISETMGMIGPAIAFIAGEIALELYYSRQTMRALRLRVANLVDWGSIFRIAASCALSLPILLVFSLLPVGELVRMIVASALYFSIVLLLAYRFGVSDVGRVASVVWSRLHRRQER